MGNVRTKPISERELLGYLNKLRKQGYRFFVLEPEGNYERYHVTTWTLNKHRKLPKITVTLQNLKD